MKGRMKTKIPDRFSSVRDLFCDPAGARTQDPNIKSVVLYLLSYRVILAFCGCKSTAFFFINVVLRQIFFIRQASLCLDE